MLESESESSAILSISSQSIEKFVENERADEELLIAVDTLPIDISSSYIDRRPIMLVDACRRCKSQQAHRVVCVIT
jgi:hypothetical protein